MRFPVLMSLAITMLGCTRSLADGEDLVEFDRDIRPILSSKCFRCHGPDEHAREAELRLDVADGPLGPLRDLPDAAVIRPGDVEGSILWQRLTSDDEDEVMPPPAAQIPPLTERQLDLIRRWILQGAHYESFWAFVPPQPSALPLIDHDGWSRQRIDRFVFAKLAREGRRPQPTADKRSLMRRVSFDLTGLPPTRAEIREFLNDVHPDAYAKLVDRLMGSPRFGEHMAKYWLDLVRFADTNGIHHDHYREMTPYRDWVIRAFNDNLRFDKFVVDQIAGDLHDVPTNDELIASGFNRLHLVIDQGTAIPEESFVRNVTDRVTAVGTVFMGLTVGCAVCHDHKYDPLTQREFYQLFAFFNNIDAAPETPGRDLHAPFLRLPNAQQSEQLASLDEAIAAATVTVQRLNGNMPSEAGPQAGPREDGSPAADAARGVRAAQEELAELQRARETLVAAMPVSLIMREREEVRPTHVLLRGAYDRPGPLVERDTPAFLPPLRTAASVKTRMDLARWLTDGTHPLTARVAVNRFWQQFFGVGLVKTAEDFGSQGERPSHPELLDDLTVEFVATGWDVKRLVRSIVCSQTYRQSSSAAAHDFAVDAENRLLARGSRFRLDAEMLRDQILSVSGLLQGTMYGRSVKPPQPPNLWKNVSMRSSSTYAFEPDQGASIYRRSVYSFWKRALPPPQMTIFDAPTRESCTARRERTNTPLQALVLMNEAQYFEAAKHLAATVLDGPDMQEQRRLSDLYERITAQVPDATELARLQSGLEVFRAIYLNDVSLAQELTKDDAGMSAGERVELAAYAMLVNSLFNLDLTKTRE